MLAEAIGVRPNDVDLSWEGVLDERAESMLTALRAARDELDRWPTAVEWDRGRRRPSSRTFVRHFGRWADACWAAECMKSSRATVIVRAGPTANSPLATFPARATVALRITLASGSSIRVGPHAPSEPDSSDSLRITVLNIAT